MKHKSTLCSSCRFGIVREWEDWKPYPGIKETLEGIQAKCLLAGDFVEVVTACNRYRKIKERNTYHDPDFADYEKQFPEDEK